MKYGIRITAFLGLLIIISPAYASDLATYRCDYSRYATIDGFSKVQEKFELVFVIRPDGTVTLTGNQGSSKVTAIAKMDGSVTFIEVTESGNVMTTTVDANGRSVHSRNTVIFGKLGASQYYGSCIIQ